MKLHQNSQHATRAEFDKEPFGENHFLISLVINEIIQINEIQDGCLVAILFFNHYEFHLGPTRYQDLYMCEISRLYHQ